MDELVEAFVARKPSGLEQAYALWSRLLFSVARHAIADSGQREDCVHDALVRVWRSPNRSAGEPRDVKGVLGYLRAQRVTRDDCGVRAAETRAN